MDVSSQPKGKLKRQFRTTRGLSKQHVHRIQCVLGISIMCWEWSRAWPMQFLINQGCTLGQTKLTDKYLKYVKNLLTSIIFY